MTYYIDSRAPHLGGFHIGGDPLSAYPELWRWLVEEYLVKSVIDVGCGEGHALKVFAELGVDHLLGVDGIPQEPSYIVEHDYTTSPFLSPDHFDLCWSCEFVEHVEERYVPNFLATFACADLILMTHAVPGQGGHHHVNTREDEYWRGALAAIGYLEDVELSALTRELAGQGYYTWSGLAFRRARE